MPTSLSAFLRASKQAAQHAIKSKGSLDGWTVAVGNEAGDLDSVACAIAYAYLSSVRSGNAETIALVQTPRSDLHLRPENELALRHANISNDDLVCFDDLGKSSQLFNQAQMALVDHNKLLPVFGSTRVTAIIDHHADEGAHGDAKPRLIEATGSCSSLVATHFEKAGIQANAIPPELADLLISAILIDTNLKPAPEGKATQTDMQAVDFLLSAGALSIASDAKLALADRAADLRKTKSDVAWLSMNDLLRRDYKEYETNGVKYGLATIPLSLSTLLSKSENQATGWSLLERAALEFENDRGLDMLGVLTSFRRESAKGNSKAARELLFHFKQERLGVVKDAITGSETLQTEAWKAHSSNAPDFALDGANWFLCTQGNTRATRKQVAPIVREALEKLRK